jgi:translation initiation factor 5B
MSLRSPICVVVGHVDHGKSSLLDYIRNTNIVATEAGAITQAIGASIIPISVIKEKCGELAQKLNLKFTIPGLLFIDTPGHAAFTSLRKRGGSLADIAILVVDIEEGFKPQTIESVKILIEHKTPFVVAVNKIDTLRGYRTCAQNATKSVLGNLAKHDAEFTTRFETKMYEIVEQVYKHGLKAERFDRVTDFSQEIALVPLSAKLGDGMPELLMVLSALTQKYMEKRLLVHESASAIGTVLEVKEQKGLGTTMDVIIYDGTLKVNDTIVVGDFDQPIVTKVRGLFVPSTLKDMRDSKGKFDSIKQVFAATGVRINAPGLEQAKSGMPFKVATASTLDDIKAQIMDEVSETSIELDDEGVFVKADTLGGLEALVSLLREGGVAIASATVGEITKKDITTAQAFGESNPLFGVILGFNIKKPEGDELLKVDDVKIITAPVIYEILDKYAEFKTEVEAKERVELLGELPKLAKIHYLEGCTFRQSNPAVFGVEVLLGELSQHMILMRKDGSKVGVVKSLQEQAKGIAKADCGMKVALSMENITCGRQVIEGDIYYTQVSEQEFLKMKELKDLLTVQQKEILREIAEIMRRENPLWGMG